LFRAAAGNDFPVEFQPAVESAQIDRLPILELQGGIRGFGAEGIHEHEPTPGAQGSGCGGIEIREEPLHILDADATPERRIRHHQGNASGGEGSLPEIAIREPGRCPYEAGGGEVFPGNSDGPRVDIRAMSGCHAAEERAFDQFKPRTAEGIPDHIVRLDPRQPCHTGGERGMRSGRNVLATVPKTGVGIETRT
jgi:hypothetical protein